MGCPSGHRPYYLGRIESSRTPSVPAPYYVVGTSDDIMIYTSIRGVHRPLCNPGCAGAYSIAHVLTCPN